MNCSVFVLIHIHIHIRTYTPAIMSEEKKQLKTITRAEVKEHSSEDDCWVIIANKVYDVTPFLDEHPGGPEIITESAGK